MELKKIEQKPDEEYNITGIGSKHATGKLKEMLDKKGNHAWSEEDMSMIGRIRSIIEKYAFSQSAVDVNGELCEQEYIDADNWLKSLKDRVQPKVEWSEEDESMLYGVIETEQYMLDVVTGVKTFDVGNEQIESQCTKELAWLKILKDRYTWKPSDKQMEALKEAGDEHLELDGLDPLYTLYQDLKKLKG